MQANLSNLYFQILELKLCSHKTMLLWHDLLTSACQQSRAHVQLKAWLTLRPPKLYTCLLMPMIRCCISQPIPAISCQFLICTNSCLATLFIFVPCLQFQTITSIVVSQQPLKQGNMSLVLPGASMRSRVEHLDAKKHLFSALQLINDHQSLSTVCFMFH